MEVLKEARKIFMFLRRKEDLEVLMEDLEVLKEDSKVLRKEGRSRSF